ncbi:MAG: carbon starvation protein A [candidate division Zixibacteria bacterium]|nr:carbon starvation protein A [candidate division Zixibacteria bacterium]
MSALPIMIVVLCLLAIAYRYYSAFLAARVCMLDDLAETPAHRLNDGHNYHPTSKWVLFGHHFAAISGAGPLIGPVLAAQFGFLPGLIWLVVGVVLAGAVQDFLVMVASTRFNGRSLAEIAHHEMGPIGGLAAGIAILFVLIIALAGLGIVVVNALSESAWGTFTIATTIPIALAMGLYMYRIRRGKIVEATVLGIIGLLAGVVLGRYIPDSSLAGIFTLSRENITFAMMAYGFLASVLPVWLLLLPRDYLSSFMKIGTIALLVVGVIVVNPTLKMPALTDFISGGGPIIPGPIFPFVFITIMCGAVSGFHALVASGTTSKMISKETHCRTIGYGAMLIEGLVGVVALIAACSLGPGDYFAINTPPAKFQTLQLSGYHIEELPVLEQEIEEKVEGRTGGAVSLAIGMAKIFNSLPGVSGLLAYWYHFAIMFEALFILTTIDAGTRIARFVFQEFLGKVYAPMARKDWIPGSMISSALVVGGWGYFIYTGSINTIWPMFGIANQLLAVIGLAVGTTIILNYGRAKYAWITAIPMTFVTITTTTAAYQLITTVFWPLTHLQDNPGEVFRGYLDTVLTVIMMTCLAVFMVTAVQKWRRTLNAPPQDTFASPEPETVPQR